MKTTLAGLAGILAAGLVEHAAQAKERMEKAAALVEAEAKRVIGTYQEAAGPFEAWAPLANRTLETNTENTPGLVTGEMRDSIGTHVEEHEASIGSNDPKLLWFELGTKSQPSRHVLGTAAVHVEKEVVEMLGHGAVKTLVGGGGQEF
jgi:hypothetical protein